MAPLSTLPVPAIPKIRRRIKPMVRLTVPAVAVVAAPTVPAVAVEAVEDVD